MMRCVVLGVVLLASLDARAASLTLDHAIVDEVAELLARDGFSPGLQDDPEPKKTTKGAGGGAGGGAASLPPQLSGVGLGVQVGSPSSVTIKLGGVQQNGFVFGLGAGFAYGRTFATSLSLHADCLWHLVTLMRDQQIAITGYAGLGIWLAVGGAGYGLGYFGPGYIPGFSFFGVGARVPLGVALSFKTAPIEIYLELDPAVFVFPGIDVGVGASLGFRYHF